jgi:hypothetical protein
MIQRILIWLPLPVIIFSFVYTLIIGEVQIWVIVVVIASMLLSSFAIQSARN